MSVRIDEYRRALAEIPGITAEQAASAAFQRGIERAQAKARIQAAKPMAPRGRRWRAAQVDVSGHHYWRGRLHVISQIDNMELPQSGGLVGPTWHVSVSRGGKRCSDADVLLVRRAFGMVDAEEDNHHPGVARHLFMPVDPQYRNVCECKLNETVITEPDGYEWTNPVDEPCRGCKLQSLTGAPCPLHTEAQAAMVDGNDTTNREEP